MGSALSKRIFDVASAAVGLLLLVPLGLVLAVLIKLSDGGPVFFGQRRIGRFGKPFRIWKFRSMVVNAEKLGCSITQERDPRITRVGRLLRRTKLDELPQLWNVLMGEMSMVGPRPEVGRYVERYTEAQREILQYKPGITDLATLLFRNEEALLRGSNDVEGFYVRYCLPKKIELNLNYARTASLLRDVWIILETLCPYWLGVLTIYSATLAASFWLSYQLRSDFHMSAADYGEFTKCLPWIVVPQLVLLIWRGELRGLLSYFSIPEMRRSATALGFAFLAQVGLSYVVHGHLVPTRSVLLMDLILSFFGLCGVRMGFRLLRERAAVDKGKAPGKKWRVGIIGTGELGTNLALDFARSENGSRRVVAFFDDNPRTWHKRPHDIPVIGMPECLLNPEWSDKFDEIIVALPAERSERVDEIAGILNALPVKITFASDWPVLSGTSIRS